MKGHGRVEWHDDFVGDLSFARLITDAYHDTLVPCVNAVLSP